MGPGSDRPRLEQMGLDAFTLSIAWLCTGEAQYADRAAMNLRRGSSIHQRG
jgi:hypothetical protein